MVQETARLSFRTRLLRRLGAFLKALLTVYAQATHGLANATQRLLADAAARVGRLAIRLKLPGAGSAIAQRTRTGARRRTAFWVAISLTLAGMVALGEVGTVLTAVESAGTRSYGSGVFTGFKINPFDTAELSQALTLWESVKADTPEVNVGVFLGWHALLDCVVFIPSYCGLLALLSRQVAAPYRFAAPVLFCLVLVDEAETLLTIVALHDLVASNATLIALQLLSWTKWALLAGALSIVMVNWLLPGGSNVRNIRLNVKDAAKGDEQHPGLSLLGLFIVAGIFTAFVALPGESALTQLPDVLRYQIEGFFGGTAPAMSIMAIAVLASALVVAGMFATDPQAAYPRIGTTPTRNVVLAAVAFSGAMLVWVWFADGRPPWDPRWPALSAPFVVVSVALLGSLIKLLSPAPSRCPAGPPKPGRDPRTILWIGALPSIVGIAGALGLIRAGTAPAILATDTEWAWRAVMVIGIALATVAGPLGQWVVGRAVGRWEQAASRRRGSARLARRLSLGAIATGACCAIVLAGAPGWSGTNLGTPGVVAFSLTVYVMLIGLLTWIARRYPPWGATEQLRLGARTPIVSLAVATWFLAGSIDDEGGYHHVRVADGATPYRHANLHAAWAEWQEHAIEGCPQSDGPVPLVLVAAAGGGIKAAYWTATSLDALFGEAGSCARNSVFSFSGISGGAVGGTVWAATVHNGTSTAAGPAVAGMSRDRALSSAIAGLLMRDLPQPLTGVTRGWADRAALLEDGWIETSDGVTRTASTWASLNDSTSTWMPVLALMGSSVTDSCRIAMTNTAWLPSTAEPDCYRSPTSTGSKANGGPLTGAGDALYGLYARDEQQSAACPVVPDRGVTSTPTAGVPSVTLGTFTAALLSARFPLISPSGALYRCVPKAADSIAREASLRNDAATGKNPDAATQPATACEGVTKYHCATSYVVDGGYYEGSGLLTTLQIWSGIADSVREHNAGVTGSDSDLAGRCVEPWIVFLDSGYRSNASVPDPGRPRELRLPLDTFLANQVLSTRALEQMAEEAISNTACRDKDPGSRVVRVGLEQRPDIAAPLGWVLSASSRHSMCGQLATQLSAAVRGNPETTGSSARPALSSLGKLLESLDAARGVSDRANETCGLHAR